MKSRAVIFDIYGTLLEVGPPPQDADARWRELCLEVSNAEPHLTRLEFAVACNKVIARQHEAARARGIQWPEVCWPSVVGEVLPALTALPPWRREDWVVEQIRTGHTTHMSQETAGALRRLRASGCLLGLASNAQAYSVREFDEALASHELSVELFEKDLRFLSFEHGFSKPDPHVFQLLTTRLTARGISSQEVLMVGDQLDKDIEPAKMFGWRTWHLGSSHDGDWSELLDWAFLARGAEKRDKVEAGKGASGRV